MCHKWKSWRCQLHTPYTLGHIVLGNIIYGPQSTDYLAQPNRE